MAQAVKRLRSRAEVSWALADGEKKERDLSAKFRDQLVKLRKEIAKLYKCEVEALRADARDLEGRMMKGADKID